MAQETLKAVILTALRVEYQAVRAFLRDCEEDIHPVSQTVYEHGEFTADGRTWQIGIVEIGPGNVDSGIETNRAIEHFQPQVVLFVGIAGGLKDVDIGHVVAATKVYGYEPGKAEAQGFKTRGGMAQSSYALVSRARAEARKDDWLTRLTNQPDPVPEVWVQPIAAGEKVVASTQSSTFKLLEVDFSDAVAVEMEGYGFTRAVYANASSNVSSIVIRGISDLVDGKNDAAQYGPEPERHQKASEHASAFAFQILAKFDPHQGITGAKTTLLKVEASFWDGLFACLSEQQLPLLVDLLEAQLSSAQRDTLGALANLKQLRQAFERLDNLDLAIAWVGHIIRSAEHPPAGIAAFEVSPELQAWYAEHHPTAPPPPPPPSSPGYLLIGLDPKDDQGRVAIMAELHKDGNVTTDLLPPDAVGSVDEPEETLAKPLSEAIKKARKVEAIEVFLSWQHLCRPVHEWKAHDGLSSRPLNKFRGTVVRSLDRAMLEDFADEWFETLEDQWNRLQKCRLEDASECCHDVQVLNCDELDTQLEDETKYPIFRLLTVWPEDEADRRSLLSALLYAGIPIWFWAYKTPDVTPLSSAINQLLTADNLKEVAALAETIRKRRKDLPHLGVLFDCPTRRPAFASVSPYRQPAA